MHETFHSVIYPEKSSAKIVARQVARKVELNSTCGNGFCNDFGRCRVCYTVKCFVQLVPPQCRQNIARQVARNISQCNSAFKQETNIYINLRLFAQFACIFFLLFMYSFDKTFILIGHCKHCALSRRTRGVLKIERYVQRLTHKAFIGEAISYSWASEHACGFAMTLDCFTLKIKRFDLNHKNYNFLDCDWFKKLVFSTNSLAKLFMIGQFNKLITYKVVD